MFFQIDFVLSNKNETQRIIQNTNIIKKYNIT